jgi:radical SAM protein with 4Fe4S-binding SPASM domain
MMSKRRGLLYYARQNPRKLRSLARLAWTTKLRSARRLATEDHGAQRPPLVTININHACNLRCVQCWEWGENGAFKALDRATLANELPLAEWEAFFDQLAGWQPYLHFFGGEPFLRKDMPQLIASASRRGMLTSVNSNMTLVTEDVAEELVASGLDYMVASLDGPRDVNDSIRLGTDSYDRTVAGIRNILAARERARSPFPLIEVCCTVTHHNQAHLYETAEIADALGVDHFKLQFQIFSTEAMQQQTEERFVASFGIRPQFGSGFIIHLGPVDAALIREQEQRIRSRTWGFEFGRRPRLNVKGFDPELHFFSPDVFFGEGHCHNPWARSVVLPDGEMVVCQGFHDYKLGNIRDQPFDALWNGAAMRRFRASLTEDGLFPYCSRCCELYEMDES